MLTMVFLLVCAGVAITLAALAIPAIAGNGIGQVVFTLTTLALMLCAAIFLQLALAVDNGAAGSCYDEVAKTTAQEDGIALAVLAAASSVLSFGLCLWNRYLAAQVAAIAAVVLAAGW